MYKIFIDGQAGTTGLLIHQYLEGRQDLEILSIADADRKNDEAKLALVREADVVILCLPDDAARQTVKLASNTGVRIIDASTAHRVADGWVYGMPELAPGQREAIADARFVANPGCYPTGFLLALAPLVRAGKLDIASDVVISAVSGYTGGGRQMVEDYEAREKSHPHDLWPPRAYGLTMHHKHVPEMHKYSGLAHAPMFLPQVAHYRQGMLVSVPLSNRARMPGASLDAIYELLAETYANEACVTVHAPNDESCLDGGKLDPQANNGTNNLDLFVFGNEEQALVIARLDNLGKGAAGAAVQNLNIMLGIDELTGLKGRTA
ncbi:MAG: N-acetyl-gamma-glutamyl-phosphate reductase [Pseudomonadales bacterium]|nr:N-acetyl-gamma-glutamyl-phosphate reductase [Pseudomonadales bacterium]